MAIIQHAIFILIIFLRIDIGSLYCFLNVYMTEMFPTTVRHYIFGVTGVCSSLMIILVESIKLQSDLFNLIPFFISGISMLLAIAFMPKMKETLDRDFLDFLDDEEFDTHFNIK